MHHEIDVVKQYPVRLPRALSMPGPLLPILFQFLNDSFRDTFNLNVGGTAENCEVVRETVKFAQIEDNAILRTPSYCRGSRRFYHR